jgi:hypothetical protein
MEVAQTHLVWGSILRDRGDCDHAREHYTKAEAQFRASELPHELDKVTRLIASLKHL